MIVEAVVLGVRPGHEAEFDAALPAGHAAMATAPGFHWLEVSRGIERPDQAFVRVGWQTVEDHHRFRASASYEQWRAAIHPWLTGDVTVDHTETVFDSRRMP